MSRVLILGAGGMLGHKLCHRLAGHEIVATVRKDVSFYQDHQHIYKNTTLIGNIDANDHNRLEDVICKIKPEVIINCVGIIKQLKEADDRYLAVGVNSFLPHVLARICEQIDAKLIQISTDCVFDGKKGSYRESDISNALDVYGKSKFLGETTESEAAAITLRTSIIGPELSDPTHGLLEWFVSQENKTVKGFDRAIYSGFTTLELVRIISLVIEKRHDLKGLYQVASEPVTKYNLLCLVKEIFGLNIEIQKDEDFFCDRSLIMERFTQETGYKAPDWRSMISDMYDDYKIEKGF